MVAPARLALGVAVGAIILTLICFTIDTVLVIYYRDQPGSVTQKTLQQEGTFIWSVADNTGYQPGSQCLRGRINNVALVSAGEGYEVGDLIVGQSPGVWLQSFVYQVTEVDNAGAVVQYDVLTPGCVEQNVNVTVTTLSLHGSGFVVDVESTGAGSDPADDNGIMYRYPLPPNNLLAPLQISTYRLYTLLLDGVELYSLELDPPAVPMRLQGPGPNTAIVFYGYGFNDTIFALAPLGD